MEKSKSDLFIICGERSGDLHGSYVIKYLLEKKPSLKIHCWGGELMQNAGGILLENYRSYNLMGFLEVLIKLRFFINKIKLCQKHILEYKPKVVLLIDFPGFNMRIAKFSKKNGFNVHYYIPPKAWAWNKNRAFQLAHYTDKIYSILPFEKHFFRKYNCKIHYVGNPLTHYISEKLINNKKIRRVISLLPGSRESELKYSIPVLKEIIKNYSKNKFLVCAVNNVDQKFYEDFCNYNNVKIVYEDTYRAVSSSSLSIVMSGTASLEVAYLNIPQIVIYKSSTISYIIARLLVNVNYISLVNLILNKKLVTELIQSDFNYKNLSHEIDKFHNNDQIDKMISGYQRLKKVIGKKNAKKEVVKNILKSL
tara:strand:+ start:11504 stop:12598 length:1095 start_codon:yes stop_codon:yes gene_type:complete